MSAGRTAISDKDRERLTLDALAAVENIDSGEWTAADIVDLTGGPEAVDGLVLLVNLYEAMLHITRGVDVPEIRRAARETARTWRSR